MRTAEQLEAWLDACVARETVLGFDEWVTQQNPNVIDPAEASLLNKNVYLANDAFRNCIRPLAVRVLGDWAIDDKEANRKAHGWSARVGKDGKTMTFVETWYATGHNDVTTRKEYKVDFTGRIIK